MNLFKKTDFHERYGKQIVRNHLQLNNLFRRIEIGEYYLESYLKWNNDNVPHMPMKKLDYIIEVTTLFTNHGLATYEALKRFFLETLDLEKLNQITAENPRENIKPTSTWGNLTRSISKIPCVDHRIIDDLFDVGFRNALAHDTWYIDNLSIKYLDLKGNLVTIPFKDLVSKIHIIFGFYVTCTTEYFHEYFPELKEQYAIMEKTMNDLLPIFESIQHDKTSNEKS